MTALTALAVQNAPVLRAIAASPVALKVADLAALFGRDVENQRKTLKALAAAGLLQAPDYGLTEAGVATLAALDRAEDPGAAPDGVTIPGIAQLLHMQIAPDPLNPRKHFDPEALAELAESIAHDGLLENLVVRTAAPGDAAHHPDGDLPLHRLVAGERRWRALAMLIIDGRWPADRPILCKIVDIDDAAHRRLALVENLQRKDLRPIDEAEALRDLMAVTGAGTAEVAKEIGFTQRFVQQRLQLLELPAAKREALNAGGLTIEEARRWIAARPKLLEGLTPHQLLVMLEVAWEIAKGSNSHWTTTPCGWQAKLDTHAQGLAIEATQDADRKVLPLLHVRRGESYMQDARTTLALSASAYGHLLHLVGADDCLKRSELEPHLRRARILAIGGSPLSADHDPHAFKKVDALFKEKRHVTAWLNGPFEVDPDVKAEAERRAASAKANQAEQAEEQARRKAHQDQLAVKAEAANALATEVLRGFQAKSWDAAEMKQAFADLGAPLPWTWQDDPHATHIWNSDEGMLDANGEMLQLAGVPTPLMRLIMAALNAAIDEPPTVTLTPDPNDDEGEAETPAGDAEDDVTFVDDDEDAEPLQAEDNEDIPDFLNRLAGGGEPEARP